MVFRIGVKLDGSSLFIADRDFTLYAPRYTFQKNLLFRRGQPDQNDYPISE